MGRKIEGGWRTRAWTIPVRLVTGAFILNSGFTKRGADEQAAAALQGFAAGAYPPLGQLDAQRFVRLLSTGEIALGAALLNPLVPGVAAGAALSGFSSGLLGLYFRTPGMRREDGIRPTEGGTALAKDVWMLGIGIALVLDGLLGRASA